VHVCYWWGEVEEGELEGGDDGEEERGEESWEEGGEEGEEESDGGFGSAFAALSDAFFVPPLAWAARWLARTEAERLGSLTSRGGAGGGRDAVGLWEMTDGDRLWRDWQAKLAQERGGVEVRV
jgi:hypothetical protein